MLKIIKRYSTLKQEIYILSNFIQPLPVIFLFFLYRKQKGFDFSAAGTGQASTFQRIQNQGINYQDCKPEYTGT